MYYKVTVTYTDTIKAGDKGEAEEKAIFDVLSKIIDLTDYMEVEKCDKKTYIDNHRE